MPGLIKNVSQGIFRVSELQKRLASRCRKKYVTGSSEILLVPVQPQGCGRNRNCQSLGRFFLSLHLIQMCLKRKARYLGADSRNILNAPDTVICQGALLPPPHTHTPHTQNQASSQATALCSEDINTSIWRVSQPAFYCSSFKYPFLFLANSDTASSLRKGGITSPIIKPQLLCSFEVRVAASLSIPCPCPSILPTSLLCDPKALFSFIISWIFPDWGLVPIIEPKSELV